MQVEYGSVSPAANFPDCFILCPTSRTSRRARPYDQRFMYRRMTGEDRGVGDFGEDIQEKVGTPTMKSLQQRKR